MLQHIIDEILLNIYMNKNIIIISINRKMPIKILTSNNRIIIKENFAVVRLPWSLAMIST